MQFLDKFRRITTSGDYFPEIDGLRFIAIFTVVLFHLTASVKYPEPLIDNKSVLPILTNIFHNGWQGVELFFAISGFIIGLPFAKQYINGGKQVKLKAYFLRRLTRLEPPYLIMIVLFFFILVFTGQASFSQKLPSLLASMIYMNNLIFNNMQGLVVSVIWSLEIEVQFYCLAVLFSKVFMLPKIARRLTILVVIYGFPILQYFYYPDVKSIYLYLQFFFIGFLLADLYIDEKKLKVQNIFSIILGFFTLGILLYINHSLTILTGYTYITSMIVFYYLVMNNAFWKKVMSTKWVATIGGMCYTIYLLHGTIILSFSRHAYLFRISDYYLPNLFFNGLILIPLILIFSGLYFRLIEKPCMDKTWPIKLKAYVIKLFSKKVAAEAESKV